MLVASELEKSLKLQFKWHKARVSCFVKMLIALFAVKTVNLREMATAFQSQAYIDSRHKRLKRFFSTFSIDFSLIYIRIKEGSLVRIKHKKLFSAKKIFRDLPVKGQGMFGMNISLFGQTVYLAGARSETGELMVVATNQKPQNAIAVYLRRWEIETLFSCLKSRGFRFEEVRITQVERVEKLLALLAIGVAWAHKVGEWKNQRRPIKYNQYRESKRPQYSYFKYGFDLIRETLFVSARPKRIFAKLVQMITLIEKSIMEVKP